MDIPSIIKQQLLQTGIIRYCRGGAVSNGDLLHKHITFKVNAHGFKGTISISCLW